MLVALAGFEPAIPVPKAGVLPLDHSAIKNIKRIGNVPLPDASSNALYLISELFAIVYFYFWWVFYTSVPSHYSNGIFCHSGLTYYIDRVPRSSPSVA